MDPSSDTQICVHNYTQSVHRKLNRYVAFLKTAFKHLLLKGDISIQKLNSYGAELVL